MKKNLPITQREVAMGENSTIISITDLKGAINYVNNDFIKISGFTEEELIGKSHNIVRHPEMPPAAFQDLWDTLKEGRAWRGIVKNRCKNGDYYWVDAFVTPVYDGERVVGYQSVRTKPSRDQVREAEALYAKVGMESAARLPSRRKLTDLSLKLRISGALAFVGFLALLVAMIGIGQVHLQQEHVDEHVALVNALEGAWRSGGAEGRNLAEIERRLTAVVESAGAEEGDLEEIREHGNEALLAIGLVSLLSLISVVVVALLLIRTLINPMERVIGIAKGMAGGNLKQRIEVKTNDEVGEMEQAVKLLQARFNTVFGRFQESSAELSAAANQLSGNGAETAEAMSRQQMETTQVATAMNQMAATVQEVVRNTADAATSAHDAERAASEGGSVVGQMRAAIGTLVNEVERATGVIHQLEQQSGDISSITDTISGIAEQTNLLALNAAIEAARAGEQGRGFAVVADEVRTLASRTQEATQEIRSMLDELHNGIGEAVGVMEQGQVSAGRVIEETGNTENSLSSIGESVTRISEMNTQVATAAAQQSGVVEEMNRNVVAISDLSETTSNGAREISQSGGQLAEMANRFQQLLAQFKTQ